MDEYKKNQDEEKQKHSRLSLNSNRSGVRAVTVEVKRKKISLFDKKQAMQSGVKINNKDDVPENLSSVGDLTSTEMTARVNALKYAAEVKRVEDSARLSEVIFEEEIIEQVDDVSIENDIKNVETPVVEEPVVEIKIVENVKEIKTPLVVKNNFTEQKTIRRQKEVVVEEKTVVPVILRAASYGPRQKIVEREKNNRSDYENDRKVETSKRVPDNVSDNVIDSVDLRTDQLGSKIIPSKVVKSKKNSEDFETVDLNRKNVRKTVYEAPRKLTRHVLTRVLDDEEEGRSRSLASYRRAQQKKRMMGVRPSTVKVVRDVVITDAIAVGELANRMAVGSGAVIKSLMKLGVLASINQVIDGDTAELLCVEFGHRPKRVSSSDIEIGLKKDNENNGELRTRPPVITVMGHVDHGKTSLLDALRKTDVVASESGGITQHIGAYQIITPFANSKITFLDTPGHAAFSEMRARGANATDIVVLVVAADDCVNEQTIEAISHAKAAGAPIILAINKIDKPNADAGRIMAEALNNGLVLEEFGGEVMCVEISAAKRLNLDKLIEAILLQAEMLELQAAHEGMAQGVCIEASVDKGRGVITTILVQRGTLKLGDIFVAGSEFGRVKTILDSRGEKIEEATPSCPVEVLGFNGVPQAGDEFYVVESEQRAREIAEYRRQLKKEKDILARNKNSIEHMMTKIADGQIKSMPLVIKADVQGSLEAITSCVSKLDVNGVRAEIIHGAIGNINETDVMLAKASNAVVLGFNVKATPQARSIADKEGVIVEYYAIIYEMLTKIEGFMKGLLAPVYKENILGNAELRVVFTKGKTTKIAGCYVTNGLIRRSNSSIRLYRDGQLFTTCKIDTMKRQQDEIKESRAGFDCGIIFEGFNDIKEGDTLECFEVVEVKPE